MVGVEHAFLSLFFILCAGTLASKLADMIQIPEIVLFLLVGILLGPSALGWIHLDVGSTLIQTVLTFGALFIVFHGGMETNFHVLRRVWRTVVALSSIGIVVTAGVVSVAAHYISGVPWPIAMLLGALLSSTDPAALVPLFQKYPIRAQVAQTVIAESALTDATGTVLTVLLLGLSVEKVHVSGGQVLWNALDLLFGGLLVGLFVGGIILYLLAHEPSNKRKFRDYPTLLVVLTILGAYLLASFIHASSFMSVFIAGILLGNSEQLQWKLHEQEIQQIQGFMDTTGLKFRMFIFILLGSEVNFQALQHYGLQAVVLALVFIFVARPMTVVSSVFLDKSAKWQGREVLFLCWTRETGVIAAVLANRIAASHFPKATWLTTVTLVAIAMTILGQVSTTPWLIKKLHL